MANNLKIGAGLLVATACLTLLLLTAHSRSGVKTVTLFENGKSDYRKISDIDLCTELNSMVQVRFHKPSVYCLTEQEQNTIANELYRNRHINDAQIRRCLAMSKRH